MALTQEELNYYHDLGKIPDWAWLQQNGRSARENWQYQHKKIHEKKDREEKIKKAQKQIEKQMLDAIVLTLMQGEDLVAKAAADDIIASIDAAFNGRKISNRKKSFSAELGTMLGKALGEAPFKLLEETMKDD